MLVPLTHCEPPGIGPTRTRRPCSGMMAWSLGSPALHAFLVRGRSMAVHPVEHDVDVAVAATSPSTTLIGADAEQIVRALWVPGYRCSAVGVSLIYQADPGASVALRMYNTAGTARSGTVTLSTANGGLAPSPRREEFGGWGATLWTYPIWTADTGSVRSTTATIRALDMLTGASAPVLGAAHEIRATPSTGAGTRLRILALGVYELCDEEVAL